MASPVKNYDLFRASVSELPPDAIEKAFAWLAGSGPFPTPTTIHFDLTLRCTARCTHCSQWTWPAQPELGRQDLERLVSLFAEWGVSTLTLAGGNPLLHSELPFVLKAAEKAGIRTGIVTESIQEMSADLVDAIGGRASWIRFSLDGPTSQVHDQIRRTPGLFDSVVNSIRELRRNSTSLPIGINCVVQRQNVRHLDGMLRLARELGVNAMLFKISHGPDPGDRFILSKPDYDFFHDWVEGASEGQYDVETNLGELKAMLQHVFCPEGIIGGRPVGAFYVQHQVMCFVPLFFLICDSHANAYPCDYLQADTRPWQGPFRILREHYRLGNFLVDPSAVIRTLSETMFDRIHRLPSAANEECGCCTRFCQLNAGLTHLRSNVQEGITRSFTDESSSRSDVTFL
jgi:MoaA/NifB/PqqE/SkfB family radical SAM enzyme